MQPVDPATHTLALLTVVGIKNLCSTLVVRTRAAAVAAAAKFAPGMRLSGPLSIDITEELPSQSLLNMGGDRRCIGGGGGGGGGGAEGVLNRTTSGLTFQPLIDCVSIAVVAATAAVMKRLSGWMFVSGSGEQLLSSLSELQGKEFNHRPQPTSSSNRGHLSSQSLSSPQHFVSTDGCRVMRDGEIRVAVTRRPSGDAAWPQFGSDGSRDDANRTLLSFLHAFYTTAMISYAIVMFYLV